MHEKQCESLCRHCVPTDIPLHTILAGAVLQPKDMVWGRPGVLGSLLYMQSAAGLVHAKNSLPGFAFGMECFKNGRQDWN